MHDDSDSKEVFIEKESEITSSTVADLQEDPRVEGNQTILTPRVSDEEKI